MTKEQIEKEAEAYYRFDRLKRAVEEEVGSVPTRDRLLGCTAYLEIIGMGKEALYELFRELSSKSDDEMKLKVRMWDLALTSITGDRSGTSFSLHDKRWYWFHWANKNGYGEKKSVLDTSAPTQPDIATLVELAG